MSGLRARWSYFLNRQHRYPTGWAGQAVGRRMVHQHAPETAWTLDLLKLQPSDRVLELGSGAGRGLELAVQQAAQGQVVGVDLSATMIGVARKRNRAAVQSGNIALLRGDLTALPFTPRAFNKLFSIHTLYFWPDPQTVFADLISLLAPSGRLVVVFATGQTQKSGERIYWPLHDQAKQLTQALQQLPMLATTLEYGPDSRQYNNVAIVAQRLPEARLVVAG